MARKKADCFALNLQQAIEVSVIHVSRRSTGVRQRPCLCMCVSAQLFLMDTGTWVVNRPNETGHRLLARSSEAVALAI